MIKPVTSAGQQSSAAAAMNEAVVRHAAVQESREQRRTERAAEEADSGLPVDQTVIESASEELSTPDGASQRPHSGESQTARGASARHEAEAAGERQASGEGLKEQQEQALAQHASEQHGKRETVRLEGDRQTRSTREMMGRVESRGGARVGGDVMAAAVGSGAATADEVAPGSAQAHDRDDDNAQDVESSREGLEHRHDDAGKRVSRERALDGQAGFHDGDTSQQDSKSGFDGRRSGTRQRAGEQSDEQSDPQHRPPAREAASEASPSSGGAEAPSPTNAVPANADVVALPAAPALGGEPLSPPTVAVERVESTAATEVARPAVVATGGVGAPADATSAPREKAPDSAVIPAPPRSAAASLLGQGDEYFFFDDACPIPEAQTSEES